MVSSFPAKICFIIFVIIAFIITLVSLFTPGWKVMDNGSSTGYGLVTSSTCNNNNYNGGQLNNGQNYGSQCQGNYQFGQWQEKQDYEKVALAFMIIAGVFEIFAFIAAVATIKSEGRAFIAAPILALIAAIALIVAFAVYASRLHAYQNGSSYYNVNQPGVVVPPAGVAGGAYGYGNQYNLGYSYWLSVVAFVILIIAIIVGFVGACVAGTGGSGYSAWPTRRTPPRRQSEVHHVVRRKSQIATIDHA